jgi:hypothetical protein
MNPIDFHAILLHAELSETETELDATLRLGVDRGLRPAAVIKLRDEWHARRGAAIAREALSGRVDGWLVL